MVQIPYLLTYGQCFFLDKNLIGAIKSLVLESRRSCVSSNTVLLEENNLSPITDWLFS